MPHALRPLDHGLNRQPVLGPASSKAPGGGRATPGLPGGPVRAGGAVVVAPGPGSGVASLSPGTRSRRGRGVPWPAPWSGRRVLACVGVCIGGRLSRSGPQAAPCPRRTRPAPVDRARRAVRPGTGARRAPPRCLSPCQPPSPTASRAWRHPESRGCTRRGGGGRWPGGPRPHVRTQHPNQGVQATAASVRSCLAPAARRA